MKTFPTSFVVVETITHEVWIVSAEDNRDRELVALVVSLEGLPKYDLDLVKYRVLSTMKAQFGGDESYYALNSRLFQTSNKNLAKLIAHLWNNHREEILF